MSNLTTATLDPGAAEPILATRLAAPPRTRLRFVRPARATAGWPELYGAIALALVFVARFVPLARFWPGWGCKFRELTGWPCFSCGMTRSFDWFAQGRFLDAFVINPAGFCLACGGALLTLSLVLAPLRPPRPVLDVTPRGARALRGAAIALCLLNWGYLLLRTALTGA